MHTTTLTLPSSTVEYIHATVDADGVTNPTTDQVDLCLLPAATTEPAPADWQPGTWTTVTPPAGQPEHRARMLYPGTANPGEYALWVRVHHTPETIVRRSGRVRLT